MLHPSVTVAPDAYLGDVKAFIPHQNWPKLDLTADAEYVANLVNVTVWL